MVYLEGDARLDAPPEAISRVAPAYPQLAREVGVNGLVVVRALVDTAGRVADTAIERSIPVLDGAAVEAVRHWRYRPATIQGRRVAAWVKAPVRFSLH